jgi:cell division protein ZapE
VEPPKGLYIHGDVGRGKSALMDMFFESAPTARRRRVHFNQFMTETHQRIHEWRNLSPEERSRRPEFVREAEDDPIAPVAKRILSEAALLCLDEFQVNDVADAMILGRLFEKLLTSGVIIVLTSNTAPDDLYENGLNRQLFLPFIALIKDRLDMVELNGPRDYRLERMSGVSVYNTPLGAEADAAMDAAWRRLTDTAKSESLTLEVLERKIHVPQAAGGVARFTFDALCGEALGAADYLALAQNFHTLLIDRIPRLGPEQSNEARRFTLLIDTLYDEKVKLVCSAASPPQELYTDGENAQAFRRAASRLMEMQSEDYLRQGPGTRIMDAAK